MSESPQMSADPAGDRLLRASEVMQRLGVSRSTAYRLMSDGTLPVVRFGGSKHRPRTIRVREQSLNKWMKQNESSAGPPNQERDGS